MKKHVISTICMCVTCATVSAQSASELLELDLVRSGYLMAREGKFLSAIAKLGESQDVRFQSDLGLNWESEVAIAACYIEAGQPSSARIRLESFLARQSDKSFPVLNTILGRLQELNGQVDDATKNYKMAAQFYIARPAKAYVHVFHSNAEYRAKALCNAVLQAGGSNHEWFVARWIFSQALLVDSCQSLKVNYVILASSFGSSTEAATARSLAKDLYRTADENLRSILKKNVSGDVDWSVP